METKTILRSVELSPSSLHEGFLNDIYVNLCKKYKDTCTQDHGYIIDISDEIKIISNRISNNTANTIFEIEFDAILLKPKEGDTISCKVDMVYHHGIFAGINKLKVLIPENTLSKQYNFDQSNEKYVNRKTKKEIKIDDMIKIQLTEVRYNKNNYICIGKLK
tara:strand:- start:50 stop:535 length:486 start_codon:yes stop_codon:yes gene_type:complete